MSVVFDLRHIRAMHPLLAFEHLAFSHQTDNPLGIAPTPGGMLYSRPTTELTHSGERPVRHFAEHVRTAADGTPSTRYPRRRSRGQ